MCQWHKLYVWFPKPAVWLKFPVGNDKKILQKENENLSTPFVGQKSGARDRWRQPASVNNLKWTDGLRKASWKANNDQQA
jgi:hypothetical protein